MPASVRVTAGAPDAVVLFQNCAFRPVPVPVAVAGTVVTVVSMTVSIALVAPPEGVMS
ncbi:hypothetical protein [Streptomyces sp. NPDC088789]|uniref:hypothetical protein n=1 Tax=Streptomyces sp. NPDC088789 TaxID=3365899 RepID=UPI0037F1D8F1